MKKEIKLITHFLLLFILATLSATALLSWLKGDAIIPTWLIVTTAVTGILTLAFDVYFFISEVHPFAKEDPSEYLH